MARPAPVRQALCAGLAGAGLVLAPVTAQTADLGREAELPAHRLLMDVIAANPEPAPFTTDGCSGGLSAGWGLVAAGFPEFGVRHESRPPWEDCCTVHDRAYHVAGGARTAEQSWAARLAADEALRLCVLDTGTTRRAALAQSYGVTEDRVEAAYAAIAEAIFAAVRLGGAPCSGLSWRWGYGFPNCLRLP